jgi:hypothetical protein
MIIFYTFVETLKYKYNYIYLYTPSISYVNTMYIVKRSICIVYYNYFKYEHRMD